jgi:OOP family OmpA-OmpF porin
VVKTVPLHSVLPIAALFLLVASGARAETEFYGGIGVGYTTFEVDDIFLLDEVVNPTAPEPGWEGASFSNRQMLGFRYGDYIAVEVGYHRFGTVNDTLAIQVSPVLTVSETVSLKTSGYDASLIGLWPFNRELSALGRVGIIRWDTDRRIDSSLSEQPLLDSLDGDDLVWGIGAQYEGNDRVRMRVEGEFFDIDFARNWWTLSVSVLYAFPIGR